MDTSKPHQLTREQLYAMVWAKPVSQIAKELGLSGVGLAKICRRHDVPLPYRGFWARKEAGQDPRPIGLPNLRKGIAETVRLNPKPAQAPKPQDLEIERALAEDAKFATQDSVPEELRHPDPLVTQTRSALQGAGTDDYGRAGQRWNSNLPININVSPKTLNRALRIAQGIINGAARRGYTVDIEEKGRSAEITVRTVRLGFSIEEPSKRFDIPPDPKHPERYYTRYRYEPSGRLVLKLEGRGACQKHWAETEKRKLEDCLPDFFQSVATSAVENERWDAEMKARQERWRADERLQAEYDTASKQATELLRRLDDADGLRRLLTRLETEGVDMTRPVGEFASWRDWLLELIRVTDPKEDLQSGELSLGRPP